VIEDEKLVERAAILGKDVLSRLAAFGQRERERVELVRGVGLLIGVVLRDAGLATRAHALLRDNGVLVNLTADRVLRLFPALNISESDLGKGLDALETCVRSA
jgi:acetylornithine/succinyldiaminopimelate/putrescine aminotransferase